MDSVEAKRRRTAGGVFERKVRQKLEKEGFVVSRWQNNVDLEKQKIIPTKVNFKFGLRTHGFPDFIALRPAQRVDEVDTFFLAECKMGKYLTKTEQAKVKFLKEKMNFVVFIIYKNKDKKITSRRL